ncbi:alpha/beta hydrolase [Solimonas soli]|uniref:alpha/beta hydrolase n=1 Tax=Solimonas soli TaxID=413479 RepID=UPI0004AFD7ED|nr:alpha/beta hydrolase [Solimonas soli]
MRPIVVACLLLLTSACATQRGALPSFEARAPLSYRMQPGIVYTPDGWPQRLRGDLYRPDGDALRPAVVLLHGGAWFRGGRGEMIHIAQALAEHGYIAFSIDYRRAPDYHYPAPVDDLRAALRWLDAHADELGVDRRRVALWGYSSGAQIAGVVATDEPARQVPPIAAAVLGAMPADLVRLARAGIVERYIGAPLDEARDAYVNASPLSRISAHSAPMLLYHGTWDWLIGADNSRRMYGGLRALGVPCALYLQHGTGHFTTFLYDRGPLRAGLAFLDQRLAVPGEAPPAATR